MGKRPLMEFEAYRVIAQIAAGLAGFVGIILTVRERLAGLPRHQVAGFLLTIIGTLAFALIPDFAFGLDFAVLGTWQVIGGLFGLCHLLVYIYFLKNYPDLRRMPPVQKAVSIASIPVIGAKLALGAGLFLRAEHLPTRPVVGARRIDLFLRPGHDE